MIIDGYISSIRNMDTNRYDTTQHRHTRKTSEQQLVEYVNIHIKRKKMKLSKELHSWSMPDINPKREQESVKKTIFNP